MQVKQIISVEPVYLQYCTTGGGITKNAPSAVINAYHSVTIKCFTALEKPPALRLLKREKNTLPHAGVLLKTWTTPFIHPLSPAGQTTFMNTHKHTHINPYISCGTRSVSVSSPTQV